MIKDRLLADMPIGKDENSIDSVISDIAGKAPLSSSEGYWNLQKKNLLKALILYVVNNEHFVKSNKDNLKEVYDLTIQNTAYELTDMIGSLDFKHPALPYIDRYIKLDSQTQVRVKQLVTLDLMDYFADQSVSV